MDPFDEEPSERDAAGRWAQMASLERILPELIRRGLEAGRDTLQRTEALRNAVSDSKLPRELAGFVGSQLDEVRHGVADAVATEVRRFLRKADLAQEVRKVLTSVSFEVKAQVRFIPNEDGSGVRSEVKARGRVDPRDSGEAPASE